MFIIEERNEAINIITSINVKCSVISDKHLNHKLNWVKWSTSKKLNSLNHTNQTVLLFIIIHIYSIMYNIQLAYKMIKENHEIGT